jgi:hypothetical protein
MFKRNKSNFNMFKRNKSYHVTSKHIILYDEIDEKYYYLVSAHLRSKNLAQMLH